MYRIWKNSDSYDTVPYGPLCIEALTCRRPPRARTEIALQADVLCGLSTCRCRPLAFPAILHPSEPPSSREEETPRLHEIFAIAEREEKKRNRNFFFTSRERGGQSFKFLYNYIFIREKLFRFFHRFVPLPRENKSLGNSKINYKIYKREKKRENHWKPFPCRSIILSVPKFGRGEEEEKERTANNRA